VNRWSEQEYRLGRVVSGGAGEGSPNVASHMPTPNAVVLSAARLSGLRQRLDSARWSIVESVRESVELSARQSFADSPAASELSERLDELEVLAVRSLPTTPHETPEVPRPTPLKGKGRAAPRGPRPATRWPTQLIDVGPRALRKTKSAIPAWYSLDSTRVGE
jgi:hypothetical protein